MSATSFGDGNFGITDDEEGIIIESISFNFTNSKKEIKNRTGEDVGVTYYNEKIDISFKGKLPKTSPFSTKIAAALTLENTIPAHLQAGVSGGTLIVEEVSIEHGAEDYQSIDVKAVYHPFIASA